MTAITVLNLLISSSSHRLHSVAMTSEPSKCFQMITSEQKHEGKSTAVITQRNIFLCIWVVLRNCVPLGVGNFKLVFEGNLLLQCKYFYFLSLHVDVSDNKNNNDCQSCVLCTLNRTDVAK